MTFEPYRQAVLDAETAYGSPADQALTDEEEDLILEGHANAVPVRDVVRAILRLRGKWPGEPDPRRHYPTRGGSLLVPPSDSFGRPYRRRR